MTGVILLIIRTALALALYAFLCWVFITIWRDLQHQKSTKHSQQLPEIRIQVHSGNDRQKLKLQGTDFILGRDPTCECVLESETVSAQHARLSFHHGQWWIEDLNSTNGTFINNEKITTAVVIIPGDQIICGEVKISISEE